MEKASKKSKTNVKQKISDKILRAFANPARLKIMMCLGERPKNVSDLIGNCGLSQSAVSQHLIKLKAAGLLSCTEKGRERIYKLKTPEAVDISQKLFKLLQDRA